MELLNVRDPDTGLFNRRGLAERLPEILAAARTRSHIPSLLLVTWQKSGELLPFDPLLVLSNALRQTAEERAMTMRLDDSVLAILYTENVISEEALRNKIDAALLSLLGKLKNTIRLITRSVCIAESSMRETEKQVMLAAAAMKEQSESTGIDLNAEIRRLRNEIRENPQEDWNTTDIASRMCISKSHLHRLYKQLFNVNLMDDVIEQRLAKAKQLLEFSDMRIQEIAFQCGYRNESHFMRQFKLKVGITALQFRQSKQ